LSFLSNSITSQAFNMIVGN